MLFFKNKYFIFVTCGLIIISLLLCLFVIFFNKPPQAELLPPPIEQTESPEPTSDVTPQPEYIKWVQFDPTYEMLLKAYEINMKNKNINWIELLAYSVAKNWGNIDNKCLKLIDECAKKLQEGKTIDELTKNLKYYDYYYKAYNAVLSNFMGEYEIQEGDSNNYVKKFGLKVFSPIAKGHGYSHYDDFGVSRSYGYKRTHMGNDLLGSVGTPVIAVEGGRIEALGWNQYGGWRIGIRSNDNLRYYYYAHLRKNHPFNNKFKEGDIVKAGDVIGYLGMTGYSTTENVNNISTPHLHFGMQLIFDEKQKDGTNQIWINVYNIVKLLAKNKSAVTFSNEEKEYYRKLDIREVTGIDQAN